MACSQKTLIEKIPRVENEIDYGIINIGDKQGTLLKWKGSKFPVFVDFRFLRNKNEGVLNKFSKAEQH